MASDNEACCESDPNFAVICGFLEKFGVTCGLANIDFLDLQDMLENNQEVPQELVDLHVKLLRKARKSVSSERWERAIIKLCHGFCSQDAWEIERFGYKKARLSSKLRILKELLEMQFDYNAKFKNEVNKLSADELRTRPLGRDKHGHVYWFQSDNSCQMRVYKEDPDEETWSLAAKDRDGLVGLIIHLKDGHEPVVNEDSNSLESEKPVIDTGQIDSNSNSNSASLKQIQTSTEDRQTELILPKNEETNENSLINNENTTQNNLEVVKSTRIKLKNKQIPTNSEVDKINEKDKVVEEIKINEAINKLKDNLNEQEQESKIEGTSEKDKSPNSGISIRIKSITELKVISVEVSKKLEVTGVKEKYIRSDSSSSAVHHRKAVDSAGFDVHDNDLKRPLEEEEDVDEPSYIKRPRLDRPTLLGNKKKKPYSDEELEEEEDEEVEEEEDEEEEVSDEIEEPLMLVTGEGSGRDNEGGNCTLQKSSYTETSPIVGEAIEEPTMYFCGIGCGHDCETGNENNSGKQNSKEQSNSESESRFFGTNKADTSSSINDNTSTSGDENNCSNKTSPKVEYKLGTIIDVRTNNLISCANKDPKKKSRWDMGKPDESASGESQTSVKEEQSSSVCSNKSEIKMVSEESNTLKETSESTSNTNIIMNSDEIADATQVTPKKSMFFFGPGCLQVKPIISPLKNTTKGQPSTKEVTGRDSEILGSNNAICDNSVTSLPKKEAGMTCKNMNQTNDLLLNVEDTESNLNTSIDAENIVSSSKKELNEKCTKISTEVKKHQISDNLISSAIPLNNDAHDNTLSSIIQKSEITTNLTLEELDKSVSNTKESNVAETLTKDVENQGIKDTSLEVSSFPSKEVLSVKQSHNSDSDNQNKIDNKACSLSSNNAPINFKVPKSIVSSSKTLENEDFSQQLINVPVTDKLSERENLISIKNDNISETLEESLPIRKMDEPACTSEDKPKNKLERMQKESANKTENLDLSIKDNENFKKPISTVKRSLVTNLQASSKEIEKDFNSNSSSISIISKHQNEDTLDAVENKSTLDKQENNFNIPITSSAASLCKISDIEVKSNIDETSTICSFQNVASKKEDKLVISSNESSYSQATSHTSSKNESKHLEATATEMTKSDENTRKESDESMKNKKKPLKFTEMIKSNETIPKKSNVLINDENKSSTATRIEITESIKNTQKEEPDMSLKNETKHLEVIITETAKCSKTAPGESDLSINNENKNLKATTAEMGKPSESVSEEIDTSLQNESELLEEGTAAEIVKSSKNNVGEEYDMPIKSENKHLEVVATEIAESDENASEESNVSIKNENKNLISIVNETTECNESSLEESNMLEENKHLEVGAIEVTKSTENSLEESVVSVTNENKYLIASATAISACSGSMSEESNLKINNENKHLTITTTEISEKISGGSVSTKNENKDLGATVTDEMSKSNENIPEELQPIENLQHNKAEFKEPNSRSVNKIQDKVDTSTSCVEVPKIDDSTTLVEILEKEEVKDKILLTASSNIEILSQKQNIEVSPTKSPIDMKLPPNKNDNKISASKNKLPGGNTTTNTEKCKESEEIGKNKTEDNSPILQDVSNEENQEEKKQVSEVSNIDQISDLKNKINVSLESSGEKTPKSRINIKEVMINAASVLPPNENKSRIDSNKISLSDILLTSEKIPVSAVKSVTGEVGCFMSSKPPSAISNSDPSKCTEVKKVCDNANNMSKMDSSSKDTPEEINETINLNLLENKHLINKETVKSSDLLTNIENVKKSSKQSAVSSRKINLKDAPTPIVLLDSLKIDKKTEKAINKFNKIENKKSTKSSTEKSKNIEYNSLKDDNKSDSTDLTENAPPSTDNTVNNRRITRRTRNSNAEIIIDLTEEKTNETSVAPSKFEDSSNQNTSKRSRRCINEESTVENKERSVNENSDSSQGKGKQLRKQKAITKENKEATKEVDTEVKQKVDENVSEQKSKVRGKQPNNTRTSNIAKTRSYSKQNTSKPEEPIKSESSAINVDDIEEQIVRTEIRPSKKMKLSSEAVEVTVVDKNKRTVTTEKVKDIKKESKEYKKVPPRTRRSLRSNQQSNTDQNKQVIEETTDDKPETDQQDERKPAENDLIPVEEPKCVEKKVPLLTCVDIDKLQAHTESESENASDTDRCSLGADDSQDEIINLEDSKDISEVSNSSPITMSSFKLDTDDNTSAVRITRKRAAQQSIDAIRDVNNAGKTNKTGKKDDAGNKRPKLKKRSVDRNLRRSIEEQKLKEVSSSEEDGNDKIEEKTSVKQGSSKKCKSIAKRRVSTRSTRATDSPAPSSDAQSEDASRTDASNTPPVTTTQKKPRKQKKTLLGLEISEETENLLKSEHPVGVRQSRRIAQLKIKEEAERRKLEEVTLQELKDEQRKRKGKKNEDKDYKMDKKKRSKNEPTEDETTGDAESDEKKKRKRKRKHWNPTKQFDIFKAWKASSSSSSSEAEDEEEEIEEDDQDNQLVLKSDHEFSPESDLEEDGEVQPLKRARTARKGKESDAEEEADDCACQKCGQKDHPEWILLCDSCDSGWHCSCLRPALLVIPEGDWFCPPCQHLTLVNNLEIHLIEYDKKINKREMETRRKERLAYVGISLDNVLPSKESDEHRSKHRHQQDKESSKEGDDQESDNNEDESDSEGSDSDSESSSSSGSDSEPVYQLRERRQAHSYRFNDYDELINSAIQDELEAVKGAGNQGRGKDIANIVNAEKEEAEDLHQKNEMVENLTKTDAVTVGVDNVSETAGDITVESTAAPESLPPVVPQVYDDKPVEENDSDNELIRPIRKIIGKKKHRKLNSLDVSSEDDAESDEDFKGSSTSESEEDFDEEDELSGSGSSDDVRRGRRRKDFGPVRRSTRARISRYDRDFINDDTDSEEVKAPRRKKTRSVWDESESEESDRSWGKRKRKAAKSKRRRPSTGKVKKSKKKKKKRSGDDSDPEVYRKRPHIKFGGLNEDEDVGRRTRGKKINYLEALGTDSEEEMRRKPPRIEESEEEYNVHEDEEFQKHLENDRDNDSDESGVENVLKDIAAMPRAKPRGRGKAGLKIPRKPTDAPLPEFPTLMLDLSQPPENPSQPMIDSSILQPLEVPSQLTVQTPLIEPSIVQDSDLLDMEDELDPIEQINKNVEQMNEQEMEKMMEEEDYANKQLQLIALQIEKEKKRKEREAAKKLEQLAEQQKEQKTPKKRGRKPKNQMFSFGGQETPIQFPSSEPTSMLINSVMSNNDELSEPSPGMNLPMFSEIAPALNADGTPKKRRGRGKGKKTLAAEAAAMAAAAAVNKDNPEIELGIEGTTSSGSNAVSPAPDSPMHGSKLGIAAPPQPFSQSQPTPSVITRMLQSQPGQGNFPIGNPKYFGGAPGDSPLGPPPVSGAFHPGASVPRGPISGPFQQPPGMPHYASVRGGPAPHQLHSPGPPVLPPMYHSHRSMDPSPSGGGPINVSAANRDRHSPAIVPPASGSPLSKGDPTPPPPPYTRPQVGHFPPGTVSSTPPNISAPGSRHVSLVPPHLQQHRPSNMSPYHPGVPPNYHYGSYPPPPTLNADEGQPPPVYPNPPYSEPYPSEGGPAVQVQPSENITSTKSFEEETGGEFVGLVSYFSSQREDDLDT